MPSFPVPQGRRSKRVMSKRRASLVINLGGNQKIALCIADQKIAFYSKLHTREDGPCLAVEIKEQPVVPGETGSELLVENNT